MRTVLAHGVFEILHVGHLRYLQMARALGDRLIVSVTGDKWAAKGPGRPVFTARDRMEMLCHLDFIDNVILSDTENSVPIIKMHKPEIYCKGADYKNGDATGNLDKERQAVESYGGKLVILHPEITHSSTAILTGKMLADRIAAVVPANEIEASGHRESACKA